MDLNLITSRNKARVTIREELGFPNASVEFIKLLFVRDSSGIYEPTVNFGILARELNEHHLVKKMAEVVHLPQDSDERMVVVRQIRQIIKKIRG